MTKLGEEIVAEVSERVGCDPAAWDCVDPGRAQKMLAKEVLADA